MSGKSTFLRTIGFNMVLGYIGSPVRAEKLNSGIFSIYTCMRTQDNLEESISSFYAEILRIKLVIEAARSGEKVFFLLDEIYSTEILNINVIRKRTAPSRNKAS